MNYRLNAIKQSPIEIVHIDAQYIPIPMTWTVGCGIAGGLLATVGIYAWTIVSMVFGG